MEPKIEVLSLVLKELGEDASIADIDNRLRLQKAIYLSQLFGVDLGYRYSWYVKGPYSPPLTQDYYELAESASDEVVSKVLRQDIVEKLRNARDFLCKPEGITLAKPQWYELLASLHYLYKVSGLTSEKVRETMLKTKPHLADWIDQGERRLKSFSLISA